MRRPRVVHVRPRARRDIDDIADYLARQRTDAGRRFYDAAQRTFRRLASMPLVGVPRTFENSPITDLRSWRIRGFPNFLVFYRPTDDGIEVIRVLHGARDIEAIFEAEGEIQ